MTFEEWWWPRKPLGDELISGDVVTTAARAAWGASHEEGFSDGVKWAIEQDADTLNKLRLTLEEE